VNDDIMPRKKFIAPAMAAGLARRQRSSYLLSITATLRGPRRLLALPLHAAT